VTIDDGSLKTPRSEGDAYLFPSTLVGLLIR
jgi:hypothetical protein